MANTSLSFSEDEDKLLKQMSELQQSSPDRYKLLLEKLSRVDTIPLVTFGHLHESFGELQEKLNIHILVPDLLRASLLTKDEEYVVTKRWFTKQARVNRLLLFIWNKPIPNAPSRLLQCIRRSINEHRKEVPQHIELDTLLTKLSTRVNEQKHNEEQAKANAKQCLMKMQCKFASLILKVEQKLQKLPLNIEELKLYVTLLPPFEKHPECQITQDDKQKIRLATDVNNIFAVLSDGGYLDYKNIHILTYTIRKFGDQKTKDLVRDYYEELEKFEKDSEYNPVDSPPSSPPIILRSPKLNNSDLEHSIKFAELVTNLSLAFKQMTGINIQELLVYVSLLSDRQFSQSYIDDLVKASETGNFSHVFNILGDYWDWQDYHMLKCVVEEFGVHDMVKMVAEYESLQSSACVKAGGLETEVQRFRIQLGRLVLSTLRFLERSTTTLATFHQYIIFLPAWSRPYSDHTNRAFDSTITEAQTWAATFLLLNPFWDYLNFYLLQDIIDKFIRPSESHEAKQLTQSLDAYCINIAEFQKSTRLKDLIQVLPNGNPPVQSKFVKMSLKINCSLGECTIEYCENFRQSFISAFCLHNHTLIIGRAKIHDAKIGAYSKLKCYIPSNVACLVVLEYWKKTDFFRQHNISDVTLHNHSARYYFSFPTTEHHQNTLKRALFVPPLAEVIKAMEPDILVKVEQSQSMTSTVCDQRSLENSQTGTSLYQSSDHQSHQFCTHLNFKRGPTLQCLLKFPSKHGNINIPEKIGVKYLQFGILLLDDNDGCGVDNISRKCNNDVCTINLEILKMWIQCGNDVSWKKLTDTLKDIGHGALATEINSTIH